ncbi:ATP-binding protein [Streptomyces sp. NPDC002680]|uniref:ATP-binding protein n=1 Tax=Streptomyces sp. NPDC002680 TaxID=3364659 RepID=UPI0036C634A2
MFVLPATPASVGAARRKVRELLGGWSVGDDTVDNALLVTSELVTNALTHTASERIVCRLRLSAGRLHVEVEDENRGGTLPAQRMPGPDEQCGRGLLLVGILSSDWGVRDAPHGSGRIVWSELPAEYAELTDAAAPTSVPTSTPTSPVAASASDGASAPAAVPASAETPARTDSATSVTTEPAAAPATPATPAPVRPAPVLPPTPPAAHAAQVAAPAPWQPPAPHRTRPVPHSAEGTASHGPYGPYGTTATHHSPYSRS